MALNAAISALDQVIFDLEDRLQVPHQAPAAVPTLSSVVSAKPADATPAPCPPSAPSTSGTSQSRASTSAAAGGSSQAGGSAGDNAGKGNEKKKKKQTNPNKKPKAPPPGPTPAICHFQVSEIMEAEPHPDAPALIKMRANVGEFCGGTRQILAGLAAHFKPEDLVGKKVVTIMNLQPRKLRGLFSEAMIMAGNTEDADGNVADIVCCEPPAGSEVGDRIWVDDGSNGLPEGDPPTDQIKPKKWKKIVAHIEVFNGMACYKEAPMISAKGPVTVPGLPDGADIH